jgi:D-glycero-D-manno-heptose 1,7-bisphosphate phosphatase
VSAPRLVLLDRDGTINRGAPEGDWVIAPEQLELLPGAAEAVRRLNDADVAVAVVTNQRCIALGRLDAAGLDTIHARLQAQLHAAAGSHVDAFFHCPHERGSCACRKPEPGLLHAAAAAFAVRPEATVMVGDAASDVEAGRRFGARTLQVGPGRTLLDAVEEVLRA